MVSHKIFNELKFAHREVYAPFKSDALQADGPTVIVVPTKPQPIHLG